MDKVRVLRVLEYVGDRAKVEAVIAGSIHGSRVFGFTGNFLEIRAATIGVYPEILSSEETNNEVH
jgi:hypothetical protein